MSFFDMILGFAVGQNSDNINNVNCKDCKHWFREKQMECDFEPFKKGKCRCNKTEEGIIHFRNYAIETNEDFGCKFWEAKC